jgi:hypothetical protein
VNRLAAFIKLPGEERRLLLAAFAAAALFRLALYFVSLERLRALATRAGSGRRRFDHTVDRLVWAGRTAARWIPGTTCLSAALALQGLLSRYGHASELHIGVARDGGGFAAHAWVERDGCVLIGEDEKRNYTKLMSWSTEASPSDAGASGVSRG